jgi:hypothetical protein
VYCKNNVQDADLCHTWWLGKHQKPLYWWLTVLWKTLYSMIIISQTPVSSKICNLYTWLDNTCFNSAVPFIYLSKTGFINYYVMRLFWFSCWQTCTIQIIS